MCAAETPERRRKLTPPGPGARDLLDAFRRYYDKVESDSDGQLVLTCKRCHTVEVIHRPSDVANVLGVLNFAHENHRHR